VGVVFRLGGGETRAADALAPPTPTAATDSLSAEAPLLGIRGREAPTGFVVTSAITGSPAAQVQIQPGDLIYRIDSRDVRSARDIELAIAGSTSGTVRIFTMRRNIPINQDMRIR
jgi:C-terminal processing protease CtpA/Prc